VRASGRTTPHAARIVGKTRDDLLQGILALGIRRGLGGDFEDDGGGVGIGLDIELGEGDEAAADEDDQAQEDDGPARQSERQQLFEHR